MKVYVINLDRNADRLAFMTRQLAEQDVAFERFSAIDGRVLDVAERKRCYSRVRALLCRGIGLQPGEIGCALSHLAIYRLVCNEKAGFACVLEDDAALTDEFASVLQDIERTFDPSRKVVILLSCGLQVPERTEKPEFRRMDGAATAVAYVITPAAAAAILKVNFPVITVADAWGRFCRRAGLEFYRRHPTVAWQDARTLGTDIVGRFRPIWANTWYWKLWRGIGKTIDWILWKVTGR